MTQVSAYLSYESGKLNSRIAHSSKTAHKRGSIRTIKCTGKLEHLLSKFVGEAMQSLCMLEGLLWSSALQG